MESREAVDLEFSKFWLIIKRRFLPIAGVYGFFVGLALVAAFLQKPVYQAEGKLLIKKTDPTSLVTGLGEKIGELDGVSLESNPLITEIEIINSIPLLQKTIDTLSLKDEEGVFMKPKHLKEQLKLKNIPGTDVVQIAYEGNEPQETAAVVNKLMLLYINEVVVNNRTAAVNGGEFIAMQLPKVETTVREAEAQLREFKEQNQVVALDEEAKSAVEVIKELEIQIADTQAQLADANVRSAKLQEKVAMDSQEGIAMNSLYQSAGVQKVLEEFQKIEGELAVQRTRFAEGHPVIKDLQDKRAALKALLQERVEQSLGTQKQVPIGSLQVGELKQNLTEESVKSEVERLGLAKKLTELSNSQSVYKQRVNNLPKLEQQQRELERRLEAAQSTYEILLKKLQEVRIAANQNIGNVRIVESALVPENASIRKPATILALGNILGILGALATTVFLEVRDPSIKTIKEARKQFGYPFLGAIPYLRKKATKSVKDTKLSFSELLVKDSPCSPISEVYRIIETKLSFLSSDKALQVILVTSSVPKEGKSTVSANLATVKAQLGHRVLLVDADMRRPSQHRIWKLPDAAGLSDVIVGQAEFEAVVTKVMPNLDVLTAGVIPPNPMALLASKRMASLMEYFSKHYDFLIIDTPPLVLAADALTLGKMTDGVLLVARPGVVDFASAATAKESLEHSGQNVLGLVLNGVLVENEPYSYSYYTKEYVVKEDSTDGEKATSMAGKNVNHFFNKKGRVES